MFSKVKVDLENEPELKHSLNPVQHTSIPYRDQQGSCSQSSGQPDETAFCASKITSKLELMPCTFSRKNEEMRDMVQFTIDQINSLWLHNGAVSLLTSCDSLSHVGKCQVTAYRVSKSPGAEYDRVCLDDHTSCITVFSMLNRIIAWDQAPL